MDFTDESARQATELDTAELDEPGRAPLPTASPLAETRAVPAAATSVARRASAATERAPVVERTVDIRHTEYTQELPRSAPTDTRAGVLRSRYVLEEKIGEGGTSVVWRARDLRRDPAAPGGQRVALKVLRPGLRNQERAVERLRREFHHAQTLSHPAIARVYDVDCEGDTWFLTLELFDGESLAAILERAAGPLPVRRALDILRVCGEALSYAHERGVVHGDFKPGNVFVTTTGQVRVLDFGSASSAWFAGQMQVITATPAYASPEVLAGHRPELRDDVFSFACVAYEMLTGRHPFDRRTSLEARDAGHLPERDWNLSARQWHALESGLSWSREERPASVRALVGDVTSTGDIELPIVMPDIREPTAQFRSPRLAPISAFTALAALGAVVFVAHSQLKDLPPVPEGSTRAQQVLSALPLPAPLRESMASVTNPSPASPSAALAATTPDGSRAGTENTRAQASVTASGVSRQAAAPAVPVTRSAAAATNTPGGTQTESVRRRAQRLSAAPMSSNDPPSRSREPTAGQPTAGEPLPVVPAEPNGGDESTPSDWTVPTGRRDPATTWRDDPTRVAALVSFDVESITVSEGASVAVLRINRRHQLDGRATVLWRTLAGSARPGVDFREVAQGVAEFADGQTTRAIYVPLLNDLDYERDESFVVELYSPDGLTRINPIPRVRITLRDNDAANQYRVADQQHPETHTR